ncbi:MAG: mechanosensitive ion channel family protein [Clostridia bacterium]|nr:mechanosensitive ion channel family protein [Clostridia bacterium]
MKKNENKTTGRKRNNIALRIIGVILIALIIIVINVPKALFFLTPAQQEAVGLFRQSYLDNYVPVKDENGGFDVLRVVALIVMIAACWAAYTVIKWILSLFRFKNRRAETFKGLLSNVIRYAIVIFAIIFGLNILGADVLTVIAGLGILALIIGFGAQSLIEDIFSGLFILFEGRFFVGDIISVDDFRGKVVFIGIVSTQIMDVGGNIRVINNSDIRVLTNLSEVTSVAVSLISIPNSADLEAAEEVVRGVTERMPTLYPELFPTQPRYVGVEEVGETSIELKVIADVEETNIYNARRMLNRELKLALTNIRSAFDEDDSVVVTLNNEHR